MATNACVATPANTPVTGALSATDPEGQPLVYSLLAPAGKGAVNLDTAGNFAYTPNDPSLRGLDKFTYEVTDGALTATGTVWVAIGGAIRIDPLGDSITAGYPGDGSAAVYWVGYRRKLFNDLTALYSTTPFGINFVGSVTTGASASPPLADLDNEGHPGWCDDNSPYCNVSSGANIADSVSGFLDLNPPDIILLHIGTNEFSTSSAGVNTILDNISIWAQAHYPVTVFVARIIPAVDGTMNVDSFNNNVAAIATDRPAETVYLVDQQSTLQLPGQPNTADPSLMGDNLHPNQTGYDLMADTWEIQLLSTGVLPSCP